MKFLKKLPLLSCAIAIAVSGLWLRTHDGTLFQRVRSYTASVFSHNKKQSRAVRSITPYAPATGVLFERCLTPEAHTEREQYAIEIVNNTESAQFSKRNAQQQPELIKTVGQEKEIAACKIARKIVIRPELRQRIVLVCVHGTNSSSKSYGGVDERPLTQELKNFATYLSQHYNCGVEILPFSWSGSLKSKARLTAGTALAQALQKMVLQPTEDVEYTHIWTFSHSHGCNVVNVMSGVLKNALQEKSASITITSVHIASPIVKNEIPHVVNIDHCYHFYGAHDATQAFASILASHNPARTIDYPNVTNICMMDMAKNLDHKKIKIPVVKYLPKLLYTIDAWYKPCTDLIASTPKNTKAHPFVCIKDQKKMRVKSSEHEIVQAQQHTKEQEAHFAKTFNKHINQPLSARQRAANILRSAGTEIFARPE